MTAAELEVAIGDVREHFGFDAVSVGHSGTHFTWTVHKDGYCAISNESVEHASADLHRLMEHRQKLTAADFRASAASLIQRAEALERECASSATS